MEEAVDPGKSQTHTSPLEKVLENFVNEAGELCSDVGRQVVAEASAKGGLNGRLHREAKKRIDPIHDSTVKKMVESIAVFATKNHISLAELFLDFRRQFDVLNARLLIPGRSWLRQYFAHPITRSFYRNS